MKVGSFAARTGSTGTQAISGLGFQPKAIIFWWAALTGDGVGVEAFIHLGMAASPTSQASTNAFHPDGTSSSSRRSENSFCIKSGALEASLQSFDTDGFTLNWTVVGTGYIINYAAFSPGEVTNAFLKEITSPTSISAVGYTGVGFKPDAVLVISAATTAADQSTTSALSQLGWATGAGAEAVLGINAAAGSAANDTSLKTNKVISLPSSTTPFLEANLQSFDADGFTLDWTTVAASARYAWVLCLKGGPFKIGTVTQPGVTGNQATSGVGFQPTGLMLLGSHRTAVGIGTPTSFAMGAASGSAARAATWMGTTADTNAAADQALEQDMAVNIYTAGTPTLNAQADLVSFNSDGFTLNWTTVDATARLLLYLAVHTPPVGTTETRDYNLNAVLRSTSTRDYSIEALVRIPGQRTYSLDAQLILVPTKAYTIEALLLGTSQLDYSLNANLGVGVLLNYDLDVILKATTSQDYNLDGILLATIEASYDLDGNLVLTRTRTYEVEAGLVASPTVGYSLEVILAAVRRLTVQIRANLSGSPTRDYDLDALIKDTREYLVNAHLVKPRTRTYRVRASLIRLEQPYTADAYLVNQVALGYNLEVTLQGTAVTTYQIDAIRQATRTRTYRITARLVLPATFTRTRTYNLNAGLTGEIARTYNLNARVVGTSTGGRDLELHPGHRTDKILVRGIRSNLYLETGMRHHLNLVTGMQGDN